MKFLLSVTAIALCLSSHISTPKIHVSRALMVQATHVAVCEEGGWHNAHGPTYFGALGWLDGTWQEFRLPWMSSRMDEAAPIVQAWALGRFATRYGMPDLHGTCSGY